MWRNGGGRQRQAAFTVRHGRRPGGATLGGFAKCSQSLSSSSSSAAASRGRQKLLAIWGQVQSYAFQVELLKRCDPRVASTFLAKLKANALTTRYLRRQLDEGMSAQRRCRWTALACSAWLAVRRAIEEGETVVSALEDYARHGNARAYFEATMGLSRRCRFHADCRLRTYGGDVSAGVRFLHDAENVLKQLNYCHLIVSAESALEFLDLIESFLMRTAGSGGVVPEEIYDPSHPCSVCFEELCVTANRGESANKRVVGKICDHVTKQIRVRVGRDEIGSYLPHAAHVDQGKRAAATAALSRIDDAAESRRAANAATAGEGSSSAASVRETAEAALDAHNVFVPASGSLYAVSELRFWLAASGERVGGGASSRNRTVDAFSENLEGLEARERDFDVRATVVELALFGRRMEHFERAYDAELRALPTVDRLLLGGKSCSPDDTIEALIKACYDHHLSAPLLRRLADPEKAAEEALKKALEGMAREARPVRKRARRDGTTRMLDRLGEEHDDRPAAEIALDDDADEYCYDVGAPDDAPVIANEDGEDDEDEEEGSGGKACSSTPRPRLGARPRGPPGSRRAVPASSLRPLECYHRCRRSKPLPPPPFGELDVMAAVGRETPSGEERYWTPADDGDYRSYNYAAEEDEGWMELANAAVADSVKRRKMYAEHLTKRSLAALDRCVTEQRRELEKTLRVNVYGEVLVDSFVAVFNGFSARRETILLARETAASIGARVVDNRTWDQAFDAHRFMMATLLRRRVDPAVLPGLTHKFFHLVNGPLFDHDRHAFAQPPNTALYFSVENVGLLPHLKEELARFMIGGNGASGSGTGRGGASAGGQAGGNGGAGGKGSGAEKNRGSGGADWTVSAFRGFYDFEHVDGVTAAQRLAWKYIKELILASSLFSSVFRCGEIRLLRADAIATDSDGEKLWYDGIYLTYETECPLVAILGSAASGRVTPETTVILDSDVFSLLYTMLQKMAPGAAERAREADDEDAVASVSGSFGGGAYASQKPPAAAAATTTTTHQR